MNERGLCVKPETLIFISKLYKQQSENEKDVCYITRNIINPTTTFIVTMMRLFYLVCLDIT